MNTYFGSNAYFRAMFEDLYPNNCGCGSNAGGTGPCAAKQIQNRLNNNVPPLQSGQYFTNVSTGFASGAPYFWTCPSNCFDVCLGPGQLSSLTQSGWNGFVQYTPTGKSRISATVYSLYSLCCPNAIHAADFRYGILHQSGGTGS